MQYNGSMARVEIALEAVGQRWEFRIPMRMRALLVLVLTLIACSDSDPLEEIRKGHAQGNYGASVDSLRELVDSDPRRSETNFLLGLALLRSGESGSAIWPLRVAVEDPEYAVEAGVALTEAALQSRFKDEAIQAANAVLALDPENIPTLEMRIQAYQEQGRNEETLLEIARVLELDPSNKKILVPRVIAYLAMGDEEDAAAALETAREALKKDPEETDSNPGVEASRGRLCVVTGMFTFERGDPEGADQQYEKCVKDFPEEPLVVRESAAYNDRRGRPERSTEIIEAALAAKPISIFRTMLAERMGALGKIEEKERLLREEAEETGSGNAWFLLGDHYVRREMLSESTEAFQRAVEASPDALPMIRFAYADTLIQIGEYDRAREVASELQGTALGDLIKGRALAAEGELEEALAAFEAGIKLWPNNAGARFLAGQTAEQLGRFEEAASQYREAIRADRSQTEAALYLARLQEAQGEYAQALERVGHYVRSHPDDPEGYIATIRLAQRVGQNEIVKQGLGRLARLPGQQGVALSISANLVGQRRGPEKSVELITNSPVDLSEPGNRMALEVLVGNLLKLGQMEAAGKYVQAAIEAHPDFADFHALYGRLMRAGADSISQGREAFQRAIRLDEDQVTALAGLAALEAEAGNHARAIELYDRASRADSERAGAAVAALRLLRQHAPPEEQEARGREFLLRHLHSASLAGELAQVVAIRGDEPADALNLAKRAALFERGGHGISIKAFEAVAEMAVGPEAAEARSTLKELKAEKS